MTKKQPPVPWEPADKACALVLLRENQGALRATARQWNALGGRRLTEATLRLWRDNPAEQPAVPLVVDATRERIGVLKSILRRLEQGFDKALEEQPGIVPMLARKHPAALATTIGIITDKVRLLEGESTENTAVQVTYVEPGSLRKLALSVIEGGRDEEAS